MSDVIESVDFSYLSIDKQPDTVDWDGAESIGIGKQIVRAFETIGFVYLRNVGITKREVDDYHSVCAQFFQQTEDVKKLSERAVGGNQGYVCTGREALEPGRPADLREAFNMTPNASNKEVWPSKDTSPHFQDAMTSMFHKCHQVTNRILQILAVALDLQDKDFFTNSHSCIGGTGNSTTLRALYYPAVTGEILPRQIRCGEHSDYGTITLLFQDQGGGLQVKQRTGEFTEALPMADAVLVNVGDLLMRWTSDRLVSTRHRVLVPDDDRRGKMRQSTAYFVHPDDDYLVECVDHSSKYPPISALDYLLTRFKDSYGEGN